VAMGETLPLRQDEIAANGHAIEARIYAEDADKGFLPAAGTIRAWREPAGAGIRIDTGFRAGDAVTPYYDALLARRIAWGADRPPGRGARCVRDHRRHHQSCFPQGAAAPSASRPRRDRRRLHRAGNFRADAEGARARGARPCRGLRRGTAARTARAGFGGLALGSDRRLDACRPPQSPLELSRRWRAIRRGAVVQPRWLEHGVRRYQ